MREPAAGRPGGRSAAAAPARVDARHPRGKAARGRVGSVGGVRDVAAAARPGPAPHVPAAGPGFGDRHLRVRRRRAGRHPVEQRPWIAGGVGRRPSDPGADREPLLAPRPAAAGGSCGRRRARRRGGDRQAGRLLPERRARGGPGAPARDRTAAAHDHPPARTRPRDGQRDRRARLAGSRMAQHRGSVRPGHRAATGHLRDRARAGRGRLLHAARWSRPVGAHDRYRSVRSGTPE